MPDSEPKPGHQFNAFNTAAAVAGGVVGLEVGRHLVYPRIVFDDAYRNHLLDEQIGAIDGTTEDLQAEVRQLQSSAKVVEEAGQSTEGIDQTISLKDGQIESNNAEHQALVAQKMPWMELEAKSVGTVEGLAVAGAFVFWAVAKFGRRVIGHTVRSLGELNSD